MDVTLCTAKKPTCGKCGSLIEHHVTNEGQYIEYCPKCGPYFRRHEHPGVVTIIRGLPGSGKSTYAHKHFGGSLVIEGDQRFVDAEGKYEFEENRSDTYSYICDMLYVAFLHNLKHVIITTSSGHQRSIDQYAEMAKRRGYEVRVMWLDYLNGGGLSDHQVPKETIDKMKKGWELYPGETYARRVHVGNNKEYEPQFSIKIVDTPPPWYLEQHK